MGIAHLDVTDDDTLTAAEMMGYRIEFTGDTKTLTLPAVSGLSGQCCIDIVVGDALAKHIDLNASDHFELHGTDLDAGDKISIAEGNQGARISICYDGNANELRAYGDYEFTDGGV